MSLLINTISKTRKENCIWYCKMKRSMQGKYCLPQVRHPAVNLQEMLVHLLLLFAIITEAICEFKTRRLKGWLVRWRGESVAIVMCHCCHSWIIGRTDKRTQWKTMVSERDGCLLGGFGWVGGREIAFLTVHWGYMLQSNTGGANPSVAQVSGLWDSVAKGWE